ncbi:MAG: flagellar hook-length control protein FliK [Oscillospiraceae bacterium]|nr:flagellar hook-length control protein FliK [Oscillospiraceae bacterium]
MEVKNPMVDQMLVNVAVQSQTNAKPAKDAEQNDFGSMVNQKRSGGEKPESKPQKAQQQKPADNAENKEEKPADEGYAVAAVMMYQAMPDPRLAMVQSETAETGMPQAQQLTELTAEPEQLVELAQGSEASTEQTPVIDLAQTARAAQPELHTARMQDGTPRIVEADAAEETSDEDNAETAQMAQDAPLFERVDAPVVKVAEAPRPIPLEAENGIERLGDELNLVVNSADANRVELTLTPENLGKLTVEITRGSDGTVSVVLHTTTERAANLLDHGMDGLRQMLSANSQREVQVQVRGSEETQQQFLNPDGQNEQENRQQQQNRRREEQRSTEDFMQQLRLGLVDVDEQT